MKFVTVSVQQDRGREAAVSVFLIALAKPDATAWSRLRDNWPDRHRVVSDTLAMVAPDGILSAAQIKEIVGIGVGDAEPAGLVVDMPRFGLSGALDTASAQWLRKAAADGG